ALGGGRALDVLGVFLLEDLQSLEVVVLGTCGAERQQRQASQERTHAHGVGLRSGGCGRDAGLIGSPVGADKPPAGGLRPRLIPPAPSGRRQKTAGPVFAPKGPAVIDGGGSPRRSADAPQRFSPLRFPRTLR